MARRSMCATRSCTTNTSSNAEAQRRGLRRGAGRGAGRHPPVIFSAHGVPKSVPAEAAARKLFYLDATCPLVTKVHREAEVHHARGRAYPADRPCRPSRGHRHDGPAAGRRVTLIETVEEWRSLLPADRPLAYVTQTTFRSTTRAGIVAALQRALPGRSRPHKEDICYATTNRQEAVKRVAPLVELMLVVGSPNSSNSHRLREVAERAGCPSRGWCCAPTRSTGRSSARQAARHHRRRQRARGAGRGDHRRLRRALSTSRVEKVSTAEERLLPPAARAARRACAECGRVTRWPSIPKCPTMRWRLRGRYGLGELLAFKGIAEGV